MPPLPKLRVSALAGLAEQLKFSPPETARKHVERAEALWERIEPEVTYPEDWLVFQITGYRPEVREPALVVGGALRADLGALVERLCTPARYKLEDFGPPQWLSRAELCRRWGVSAKTLERSRREGLIGRRVTGPDRRGRLVFSLAMVEAFEAARGEKLGRARAFTRIEADVEGEMVRRAAAYRRRLGLTLSAAAKRLASRFGRSHEAVRQLLARHEREAREPVFGGRGPLTARDGKMIARALRWGIEAAEIGKRLDKSVPTVLRAGGAALVEMLRAIPHRPSSDELAAALKPGVLKLEPCATGLGAPGAEVLAEHVAAAVATGWPDAGEERARAMGYWFLRQRAHESVQRLNERSPAATGLDAVVTDLRWAARLKAELIRSEQLLLLNTIESSVGRPLLELPAAAGARVLRMCLDALGAAVERFDPSKGGRLAAPAGLELSRVVARWIAVEGAAVVSPAVRVPTRAMTLIVEQPARLADWTRSVSPWQSWCEPPPGVRRGLVAGAVTTDARALLGARFGWNGGPPTTMTQLATRLGVTPSAAARRENAARRAALRAALREGSDGVR
ncbi:MAG: hypothetical protein ACREJO_15390 [Phycisphaerales bacterium]